MRTARVAALVAALVLGFVLPLCATNSPQLKTLLDHLQKHYQQTNSFSAKFKEVISPAGGANREREGTVYYRKPGLMRWEFSGEDQELIVSDGKQLYSFQPDLNQVIETPLAQAFRSSSFAAFMLGIGNVQRDFNASTPATSPSDGLTHVALKPKNGGDLVEMGLDPSTLNLRTLRLTDALGDVTHLTFSDFKTDTTLDDKLFAFIPPAGADIVKAPQTQNSH